MTGSWATKIGDTVLRKGGNIQNGSGRPPSLHEERGAFLFLLQNLTEIYFTHTLQGGHHIIYVDNKQVIDHSTLPPPESGPTKILLDDYNILNGIKHYTHKLETKYGATLQLQYI